MTAPTAPTPRPHKPGTSPNTTLILTPDEIEYINRVWRGSKSAAIHHALNLLIERETTMQTYKGYQIVRGEYTGTNDDRADRWYIQDPDPAAPVMRLGAGYRTIREAKEAIDELARQAE